jgi:hypothetical protein
MRHRAVLIAAGMAALSLAIGSFWLRAQRNDSRPLASLLPSGALLYLEAKDFHQLLQQWAASEERRRWLASDNASVLLQSRLLQRLMQAQTQFATVAGLPIEMNLIDELAGTQSAFAFYEFSTVHFVYLTRLEGTRLEQSSLWKNRRSYQARDVAGIPFYVKTETEAGVAYTVAVASHDGWLVVTTEPGLMARTLALLARQPTASIVNDPWFADTVKQAPKQGDLRLVYNLGALRKTPQFRTYWIQRNGSELAAFLSGSADVFEQPGSFEERRVLLRVAPPEKSVDRSSMSQVLSHISPGASLYRAWNAPSRDVVRSVLQQVILSEPAGGPSLDRYAPQVSSAASNVGSDGDLETRIEEPAFLRSADSNIDTVADAVMAMQPLALLHSQVTRLTGDRVFVLPASEVALVCAKPGRIPLDSISITKTGSLDPLRTTIEKGSVTLSRLAPHSAGKAPAVLRGESYAAGYEHAAEWARYQRLFRLIDKSPGNNTPAFFSGNVRSLGDSLYRLQRATMVTQDEGMVTRDTVRYEFKAK